MTNFRPVSVIGLPSKFKNSLSSWIGSGRKWKMYFINAFYLASGHIMTQHQRFSPVDRMNLRQISRVVGFRKANRGRRKEAISGR